MVSRIRYKINWHINALIQYLPSVSPFHNHFVVLSLIAQVVCFTSCQWAKFSIPIGQILAKYGLVGHTHAVQQEVTLTLQRLTYQLLCRLLEYLVALPTPGHRRVIEETATTQRTTINCCHTTLPIVDDQCKFNDHINISEHSNYTPPGGKRKCLCTGSCKLVIAVYVCSFYSPVVPCLQSLVVVIVTVSSCCYCYSLQLLFTVSSCCYSH